MWFRRKPKQEPADAMRGLREQALTVTAADLGGAVGPGCFGVLMETGYPDAVATLVAFVDGTTSLYISSGGGVIGAGEKPAVRAASAQFVARAAADFPHFVSTVETPLPAPGRVRFYLRTSSGTFTAEAAEQDLGHGRHALSPVFHAGHAVITAIREASPQA